MRQFQIWLIKRLIDWKWSIKLIFKLALKLAPELKHPYLSRAGLVYYNGVGPQANYPCMVRFKDLSGAEVLLLAPAPRIVITAFLDRDCELVIERGQEARMASKESLLYTLASTVEHNRTFIFDNNTYRETLMRGMCSGRRFPGFRMDGSGVYD